MLHLCAVRIMVYMSLGVKNAHECVRTGQFVHHSKSPNSETNTGARTYPNSQLFNPQRAQVKPDAGNTTLSKQFASHNTEQDTLE